MEADQLYQCAMAIVNGIPGVSRLDTVPYLRGRACLSEKQVSKAVAIVCYSRSSTAVWRSQSVKNEQLQHSSPTMP